MKKINIFFLFLGIGLFFSTGVFAILQTINEMGIKIIVDLNTEDDIVADCPTCPAGETLIKEKGICACVNIESVKLCKPNPVCLDSSGKPLPKDAFCSQPFCCPTDFTKGKEGACVFKCDGQGGCCNEPEDIVILKENSPCMVCKEVIKGFNDKDGNFLDPYNPPRGMEYIPFSDKTHRSK